MTMHHELFKQLPTPWQPHAYQKRAAKFLLEHACAALFLDPGLGKTSITLAAIKLLIKKQLVRKVLIIAPLRVCVSVWPREIEKWEDFDGLRVEVLHGPRKDEALGREADIYVINPEGLEWLIKPAKTKITRSGKTRVALSVDVRRFKALGFDTLVVDELTMFKHIGSGRFKLLKQIHKTFGRRWGLTGSPVANGLLDLFGQCYVLDEGQALGPYMTHYRSKYFRPVDRNNFVWVPQEGAEEQIYERLAPLALRMSAEDYLDMPQLIENNIRLDLPEAARVVYDRLEADMIAKVEERVIVASNAAVASGKCRQVANGGVYLDPEITDLGLRPTKAQREWADLHMVKAEAVVDLVEELQGSPVLVAYDFEHDLARLLQVLGKDTPYIGGGVSTRRSSELERLWNRGELPVLLGQPQSIARGLNLQGAGHHVVWHSLTWDFELYDQLIRRVWRQGNKHDRVFVHHLIMRDTVDEIIRHALRSKDKGQQALFKGLQDLARRRRH